MIVGFPCLSGLSLHCACLCSCVFNLQQWRRYSRVRTCTCIRVGVSVHLQYSVHAQNCTARVSILCVKYYIMIAHYTVVLCSTAISPSGTSVFSSSSSGWQAKNSNLVLAVTSVLVVKSGKRWVTASLKVKHHCHTVSWLASDWIKDLPWLIA